MAEEVIPCNEIFGNPSVCEMEFAFMIIIENLRLVPLIGVAYLAQLLRLEKPSFTMVELVACSIYTFREISHYRSSVMWPPGTLFVFIIDLNNANNQKRSIIGAKITYTAPLKVELVAGVHGEDTGSHFRLRTTRKIVSVFQMIWVWTFDCSNGIVVFIKDAEGPAGVHVADDSIDDNSMGGHGGDK